MNDCLGCAGVPPDGGIMSLVIGFIDKPLGIPFFVLVVLFFLFILHIRL